MSASCCVRDTSGWEAIRTLLSSTLSSSEEIDITGVGNYRTGHRTGKKYLSAQDVETESGSPNMEEFTGVGTGEVMNGGFRQHGVVLRLRLPQWGGFASDQHQLGHRMYYWSIRKAMSRDQSSGSGGLLFGNTISSYFVVP